MKKENLNALHESLKQQVNPHFITKNSKSYKSTFLVSFRDKMIPVKSNDIILFKIVDDAVELVTESNDTYRLPFSLNHIESMVVPKMFYRANRQYLIAYHAIKEVENYFDRKLLIKIDQLNTKSIIVTKRNLLTF